MVVPQSQLQTLPTVHEAWLPKAHPLHRPRHGERQLLALVCALLFFVTPTLLWLFGMRPSEIENHKLAAFPSPNGWGFFTGMDGWATDNLAFRPEAIRIEDWISRGLFGEAPPFDQGGPPPAGPLPDTSPPPETNTEAEPGGPAGDHGYPGFRRVIEGGDGWLYFGDDVAAKCEPRQPLDDTIQQVTKLRQVVEASGRTFLLVVVPDKTTVVPEHLPETYTGKDCAAKASPVFWRKVTSLAGALDLRQPLAAAAERNHAPVYYPQDTHWAHEGAMEMVRAVSERIRPGVTKTWKSAPGDKYKLPADLPPLIGRQGYNQTTSYLLEPDGRTDRTQSGVSNFSEPVRRTSVALPGMLTRPAVVLGDSFMGAMSRYAPAAFTDVTMLSHTVVTRDPGLVAKTFGDNEIVILEVVERTIAGGALSATDQGFIDTVERELAARPLRR